jgi:hypothetical protein
MAGIGLSSNFNLSAALPLDVREVAADITARDAIPAGQRYDGLTVYVVTDKKSYQLQGGVTNADWQPFGTGTGIKNVLKLTAVNTITAGGIFNITTNTVNYSRSGDNIATLGVDAATFNANKGLLMYLNGTEMLKGTDVIWSTATEFTLSITIDSGDVVLIKEVG